MMEEIKKDILGVFDALFAKFALINIRYEYNKDYGCFLISVDVSKLSDSELDAFSDLFLEKIKFLQNKYGEAAPLFCINEEWFALSPDAISYYVSKKEKSQYDFEWTGEDMFTSIISINSTDCNIGNKYIDELILAA